jgi:stearoyl-CoA desaturase (Delta-9 desaturase)
VRTSEDVVSSDYDLQRPDWVSAVPFLLLHLLPLGFFIIGWTWRDAILVVALYLTRMFFITAGYHRYFSHRSYRLSRFGQAVMALGGITAAQKGPLWWSGHHRQHHRHPDRDGDVHSPRSGLWWSHAGWILSRRYKLTDAELVSDWMAFPELRLIDRWQFVGPWMLGVACFLFWGWSGVCAFALSTVLLWHATFSVNSIAHLFGRRRYNTPDDSRNCWPVALLTLGEGWHNNHHHYPKAVSPGHRPWEIDPTFWMLRLLSRIGVVKDIKRVPEAAFASRRIET